MTVDKGFRRSLAAGGLVAIVTFVASLLLLELVLRMFLPIHSFAAGSGAVSTTPNAAIYGWGYAPGAEIRQRDPDTNETFSARANSGGWKDVEHELRKKTGSVRILILGDSTTFGLVPLRNVFPRVLERLLRKAGFDAEVISMGYGGWATDQELLALKRSGLSYEPDIVICQFDTNDLIENLALSGIETQKPFRFQVVNGELNMRAVPVSWLKDMLLRSHVVFYVNNARWKLIELLAQLRHGQRGLKGDDSSPGKNPMGPYFIFHVSERGDPGIEQAWLLYEKLIEEMKRASNERQAMFVIFNTVERGSLRWLKHAGRIAEDRTGRDGILWAGTFHQIYFYRHVERLRELSNRVGAPLIPTKRVYTRFENDGHANSEGNQRMAEDICEFLITNEESSRVLQKGATATSMTLAETALRAVAAPCGRVVSEGGRYPD